MSCFTVLPLVMFMFIPRFVFGVEDDGISPESYECARKHGHLWWERFHDGRKRCEVLNDNEENEECGVCGRRFYGDIRDENGKYPGCFHFAMGWKYDVIRLKSLKFGQTCNKMDHCHISYKAKSLSTLKNVCGGGNRGRCRSVYGSYTCDCKRSFHGRDCDDKGLDEESKVKYL